MDEISTRFGPFRLTTRSNGREIQCVITLRDEQLWCTCKYRVGDKRNWTISTAHDETYKWLKRNFDRFVIDAAKKTQGKRLARA